jgi:hypothetical protein
MGDPMNWIVWIGVLATIAQTVVYITVTFRRTEGALFSEATAPVEVPKKVQRYFLAMAFLTLVSWGAIGFDYLSRTPPPPAAIVNYGFDGQDQFHGIVQFRNWLDYQHLKAILITRTLWADRDRMTDTWIAKSIPYTIDGPQIVLVTINKAQMRFAANQGNFIEYTLAVIPSDVSPDQVLTLSDIAKLGGKILAVNGQGGIPGGPVPDVPLKQN